MSERPLGVLIIAIFYIIAGVLSLIGSILFVFAIQLLQFETTGISAIFLPLIQIPFSIIGIVYIALSILQLITGVGLLKMKTWAFVLAILITLFNIMTSIITFPAALPTINIIGFIINILIILYLIMKFPR